METKQKLADEAFALRFHLEMKRNYFALFAGRWRRLVVAEKFLALGMFALSAYFIMRPQPMWIAVLAPAAGFVSILLDLVFRAGERIRRNESMTMGYVEMLHSLPQKDEDVTAKQIAEINRRSDKIEAPVTDYACVAVELHNRVAEARFGKPDYAMSLWERTVGWWFPVKYKVKMLPHTEAAFRYRAEMRVRAAEAEAAAEAK